jgi:protoporphyrin/coproporphyrin ferrochelatase
MDLVTNGPDDQKTDEQAVEAHLDAAIRELDRFRREAWAAKPEGSSNSDAASGEIGAPAGEAAAPDTEAIPTPETLAYADDGSDGGRGDATAEPPLEVSRSSIPNQAGSEDFSRHARSDIGDDDDLFAPDSSAEVGVAEGSARAASEIMAERRDEPARWVASRSAPAQSAPGPALAMSAAAVTGAAVTQANRRRWFGLRSEADRQTRRAEPDLLASVSAESAAENSPQARRSGWFGSRSDPDARAPRLEPDLLAEVSAASALDPAAPVARKRWFGFRKSPDAKSDPFVAMTEAIAPKAKGERKGWFGSRKAPEPMPEAAPPGMVDLEPVREAMRSVALGRAETPTADAAAGAFGETPAVEAGDAAPVGVLLVNLGAPDAPTARALRRYLRELLSDRRVVEKDTFAWQLRLRSAILPLRPRSKARAYRSIWNREANESPLKTITRSQADQLGNALAAGGIGVTVDWAMRYGNPSIESRIKSLMAKGCERVVLVPLYPQYASTTTATVCDEAFRVLMRLRNQPSLRIAPPYYSHPVYIEAIASSIGDHLASLSFEPEVILASFHGMPQESVEKGDPYYQQCKRTTELLRERLGMPEGKLVMTFQSRFGRAEWLQPYTDEILRRLAKEGIRNVAVVTPGFAADCVETLEEIAIENARAFRKRGGKNFACISCLNDSERGMQVIREIVLRELRGWV